MFVGEAPGFDEDRYGEPFVGPAGKLLDGIIRAMGLRREDVYIANVVKCRPPGNRTPDVHEVASCIGYLRRQIEVVRPQVLCALGSVAAQALLGTTLSVRELRGRFHEVDGIPLRVTYHPAYLLRSPEMKGKTWEDVQTVMRLLGIEAPAARRAP
jgi:DNA polymerase